MKFVSVLALIAAASVSAQTTPPPRCVARQLSAWVTGTDAKACTEASTYNARLLVVPTETDIANFCAQEICRTVVNNAFAARTAVDCSFPASNPTRTVNVYSEIVEVFANGCEIAIPPIEAPTTAPEPTTPAPTTAPEPTTPAPATPEPTTPVVTTPEPTTKTPCPLPQPTTVRPQC